MIAQDFQYFKPEKAEEAVRLYMEYNTLRLNAYYYAGGTEIITLSRKGFLNVDAVIDIKGISDVSSISMQDNLVIIGTAATLTDTADSNIFPLLSDTVRNIADHTNQNKITVGGNLCGQIIYKEAVLPSLLADSQAVIMTSQGLHKESIHTLFNGKLVMPNHALLFWIETNQQFTQLPYYHTKVTKMEKVDYPIVTIAAVKLNEQIRIALSGVCQYPFRSVKMESILNEIGQSIEDKISEAIRHLPGKILHDSLATAEYRTFVLTNVLRNALLHLKGDE